MELDKSLAVLAAFEKLYCLEQNLSEAPRNKHPFLNSATEKSKDGISNNCRNDNLNIAEICRLSSKKAKKNTSRKTPFFRMVLKKLEKEFPTLPEVKEWHEV